MTWNLGWEGRATDFVPDLLQTVGKPGPVASAAKDALWASVQAVGERDASAWVKVTANGWEAPDKPGLGQFTMTVMVLEEPGEIQKRLADQQPVDLRQ